MFSPVLGIIIISSESPIAKWFSISLTGVPDVNLSSLVTCVISASLLNVLSSVLVSNLEVYKLITSVVSPGTKDFTNLFVV